VRTVPCTTRTRSLVSSNLKQVGSSEGSDLEFGYRIEVVLRSRVGGLIEGGVEGASSL
jgi:hypothetical protein